MLLVKLPVPVPSTVFESLTLGCCAVLQHIPLAVTFDPPSLETYPPPEAVVAVTFEILSDSTDGSVFPRSVSLFFVQPEKVRARMDIDNGKIILKIFMGG